MESFSSEPIRDAKFGSKTLAELPVDGGRSAACREMSFILTVEDHIAFNTLVFQRLPFWRRHIVILAMWVMMSLGVGYVMYSMPPIAPRAPLVVVVLIHVFLVGGPIGVAAVGSLLIVRHQTAKRAQAVRTLLAHPQNQKLVGETTIRITPEEVISNSMTGTSSLRWERIHEIVETADHAFFFYAERAALIVPKRPRQAEEFEEFVDLARRYHEGSLSCEETVEKAREPEQEFRIEE
jgi:hypothetical protein